MSRREPLVIAGREFSSRLILGSGKYPDNPTFAKALEASGTDMVTVAVRRVDLTPGADSLLRYIDRDRYALLPNTAGCYTAKEAVQTAYLAREVGLSTWVKLEVIGDQKTLFPDVIELLEATKQLVKDGFTVLPYTTDDVVVAKKLEDAGAAAIMPLGAPIGSGLGLRNPHNLALLMEAVSVPVVVDAGVGTASDVAIAFELGCDAVLLNTAIAGAQDPVLMATAMKHAAHAGRAAYMAGRIARKPYATASTPSEGMVALVS
jgi:thiazole synthase